MTEYGEFVIDRLNIKENTELVKQAALKLFMSKVIDNSFYKDNNEYNNELGSRIYENVRQKGNWNGYFLDQEIMIPLLYEPTDVIKFEFKVVELAEPWLDDLSKIVQKEIGVDNVNCELEIVLEELLRDTDFFELVVLVLKRDSKTKLMEG